MNRLFFLIFFMTLPALSAFALAPLSDYKGAYGLFSQKMSELQNRYKFTELEAEFHDKTIALISAINTEEFWNAITDKSFMELSILDAQEITRIFPFFEILAGKEDKKGETAGEHTLKVYDAFMRLLNDDVEGFNRQRSEIYFRINQKALPNTIDWSSNKGFELLRSHLEERGDRDEVFKALLVIYPLIHDIGKCVRLAQHPKIGSELFVEPLIRKLFGEKMEDEELTRLIVTVKILIEKHVDISTILTTERTPSYFGKTFTSENVNIFQNALGEPSTTGLTGQSSGVGLFLDLLTLLSIADRSYGERAEDMEQGVFDDFIHWGSLEHYKDAASASRNWHLKRLSLYVDKRCSTEEGLKEVLEENGLSYAENRPYIKAAFGEVIEVVDYGRDIFKFFSRQPEGSKALLKMIIHIGRSLDENRAAGIHEFRLTKDPVLMQALFEIFSKTDLADKAGFEKAGLKMDYSKTTLVVSAKKNEAQTADEDSLLGRQILKAMQEIDQKLKKSTGKGSFIVLVTGNSSAGKTEIISKRLMDYYGTKVKVLSQDHYYIGKSKMQEAGIDSFDDPRAVDLALLKTHIQQLKQAKPGTKIQIPKYSMKISEREGYQDFESAEIVIVEGIFTLQDLIASEGDYNIFVKVDRLGQMIRRIIRDVVKGRTQWTVDQVVNMMFNDVIPAEEQFLEPTKNRADILIENNYISNQEALEIQKFELQTKIPADQYALEKILKLGAERVQERTRQTDTFYMPKDKSLVEEGEMLKLREENGMSVLNYIGPDIQDSRYRCNPQLQIPFNEKQIKQFQNYYTPLKTIEKYRTTYKLGNLSIRLDEIEGLGGFLEISYEGLNHVKSTELQDQMKSGEAQIKGLLEALNLSGRVINDSYLGLWINKDTNNFNPDLLKDASDKTPYTGGPLTDKRDLLNNGTNRAA